MINQQKQLHCEAQPVIIKQCKQQKQAKPINTNKKNIQFYWILLKNISDKIKYTANKQIIKSNLSLNQNQKQQDVYTQTECQQHNSYEISQIQKQSKLKLITILQQIQQDYATFRFYNLTSNTKQQNNSMKLYHQIINQYQRYNLIKRKMVVAFFINHQKQIKQFIKKGKEIQHQLIQRNNQKKQKKQQANKNKLFQQFQQQHGVRIIFHFNQNLIDQQTKSQQNQQSQKTQNIDIKQQKNVQKNSKQFISHFQLLKNSRRSSFILGNYIYSKIQKSSQEIIRDLIKYMKLDFVWLGIITRLGSDIQQFKHQLIQEQNFTVQKGGYYDKFMSKLNQKIGNYVNSNQNSEQLINNNNTINKIKTQQLSKILNQVSHQLKQVSITSIINEQCQNLIRQKFNSRIILPFITCGQYFHLLLSRNYFNLLYIECTILKRYQIFTQQLKKHSKYSNLSQILTLQNFLVIDDHWYRNYVLKCMPYVKFIIDRGQNEVSYSQVLKQNYKHIIPSFRPSLDQYFINICNVLKKRAGCVKQAVGSILVKDKKIIATGYNNTPTDTKNCCNGGCFVCNNSGQTRTEVLSCLCIHAEYGCILQAGIQITPGSTLYSTKLPCLWCAKLIVQGKIKKIVYAKSKYEPLQYRNLKMIYKMLNQGKIQLVQFDHSRVFFAQ